MWPYGALTDPLQSQHGLFTGCLWSLNPYGARKLIMHVLKLYGPRTAPHGAPTGPVSGRTISVKNSPGTAREHENNPYGARECDVTEALDVVNSPWTAHAGTVRGPYGLRTATNDARSGFLPILFVQIPLRVRKGHEGAVRYVFVTITIINFSFGHWASTRFRSSFTYQVSSANFTTLLSFTNVNKTKQYKMLMRSFVYKRKWNKTVLNVNEVVQRMLFVMGYLPYA